MSTKESRIAKAAFPVLAHFVVALCAHIITYFLLLFSFSAGAISSFLPSDVTHLYQIILVLIVQTILGFIGQAIFFAIPAICPLLFSLVILHPNKIIKKYALIFTCLLLLGMGALYKVTEMHTSPWELKIILFSSGLLSVSACLLFLLWRPFLQRWNKPKIFIILFFVLQSVIAGLLQPSIVQLMHASGELQCNECMHLIVFIIVMIPGAISAALTGGVAFLHAKRVLPYSWQNSATA